MITNRDLFSIWLIFVWFAFSSVMAYSYNDLHFSLPLKIVYVLLGVVIFVTAVISTIDYCRMSGRRKHAKARVESLSIVEEREKRDSF